MTRRRFFAPPAAFDPLNRTVILNAEEARHARDVLRLRAGDEVYVFDGDGNEFCGNLREYLHDRAIIDISEEVTPAGNESPLAILLGIALLKGEKFDLVIQKTVELGVRHIVPLMTERSDVRLGDNKDALKRVTRWRRIALEAAKQCGRALIPEVTMPVSLDSFLAESAATNSDARTRIFFAERNGESLEAAFGIPVDPQSQIAVAVGPEGGWTDGEIEHARAAGWRVITLGGRTLRAETAAIAILALLQHRFGDLN